MTATPRTPMVDDAPVSVVLLDGDERLTMQVVQALTEARRYRIVALSFSAASAVRHSRLCDHLDAPNWRWESGPDQLDGLARRMPGAILFPVSLAAVRWMSQHRAPLSTSWRLPLLPEPSGLDLVCDKPALARHVERQGGRVPRFRTLTTGRVPDVDGLSYPVLIKPRQRSGGVGIERLDSADGLRRRLRCLEPLDHYFVQSFVAGEDLSCGVLCRNGRPLAAVIYAGLARQGEFGPFTSIRIVHEPAVLDRVGELMRSLHWSGLANIDLRRSDRGRTYVLEINPRIWGNVQGVLVAGVNFADLLCRSALEEPLSPIGPSRRGRDFSVRDAIAVWRDRLLNGVRGGDGVSWRESGLRFVCRDPLPYWTMYRENEGRDNSLAFLRIWARQAAPLGPRDA